MPAVSVIMSVFNGEDFLEQAITSVLNQTFKDFEFIIIDDGSKDRSLSIINSFKKLDSRIKVIAQKNQGLAKSLNAGIHHAQGKYIARIDADDLCYELRLEKQYTFMEANHSVDLIGSSVDVIDETGSITAVKKQLTSFDEIYKKRFFVSPILHITFFGKKDFFVKNNGYRENFVYAQDYDLVLRGIDMGSIILNLEDRLVQYRDFQTKIDPKKFLHQFRITQLAIKLSKERTKLGKEALNLNFELEKAMNVRSLDIFLVKIFLKIYFLDSSLRNKTYKAIFSLLAFMFSRDLRQLLIRDFQAYKINVYKG